MQSTWLRWLTTIGVGVLILLIPPPEGVAREAWTLLNGGRKVMSLPRAAVVRSFVMSHMIHHRGQLTVYLRLLDIPLPEVYGQTADSVR